MNDGQNILELLSPGRPSSGALVITPGAFFSRLCEEIIQGGGFTAPDLNKDPLRLADLACYIKDALGAPTLSLPFLLTVESEAYGGEVEPSQVGGLNTGAYDYPLSSIGDTLRGLDPSIDGRLPVAAETLSILREREPSTPIIADVGAPLSILSSLLDTGEILKAFVRDKELLHDKLAHITDNTISYAEALIKSGASIIVVMDNFSTPGIVGDFFQEFTVPYINRITEGVRKAGAAVIVHICGDLGRFGEDLNLLSAEVLSVDSAVSVKSIEALRGVISNDKVLAVGVSHTALCSDTSEGVVDEVRRAVKNGARIITPSCGLDVGVKPLRLRDMVSALASR